MEHLEGTAVSLQVLGHHSPDSGKPQEKALVLTLWYNQECTVNISQMQIWHCVCARAHSACEGSRRRPCVCVCAVLIMEHFQHREP